MEREHIIQKYLSGFFILLLGAFLFSGVKEFFAAFLGAVVFYVLFKDFMRRLVYKRKWNKAVAASVIISISFFIVVLPMSFLVGMTLNKAAGIAEHPEEIKHFINQLTSRIDHLPFKTSTKNMGEQVTTFITANMGSALTSTLNMLASLLMMYFLLYFLLINVGRIETRIIYYLPFSASKIKLFAKELVDQTYSNAIGVPAVALAQGVLAYVAYIITGVPDAPLWAILTGFASIIPLVGTAIIWVPVSVYLFANDDTWKGIFVILFCSLGLGNIDNLIRMIISKRIGDVHPVITVLGIILGLKFFGLPGLVFGPLLISYFLLLIKLFYIEYLADKPQVTVTETKDKPGLFIRFLRRFL